MKKFLLYLLIIPALFAFRGNTDRPDLTTDTINDKGVYVLSIPLNTFQIVATEKLDLSIAMSYEEQLEAFTESSRIASQDYDAIFSRDGVHIHLIKYTSGGSHSGEAMKYGDWHFFFQSTPTDEATEVANVSFDQTLGPDRNHAQMMTELTALLRERSESFNAVALNGKGKIKLLSVAR